MEGKSLCIVGACKNTEAHLPGVLRNLDTVASWWKESKIVLFENDSSDRTSEMLHAWVAEKGGHREIVQETGLHERIRGRTDRLAYIRNRLLYYVPTGFDYVFMVDLDDVFQTPVRKESFESCFELRTWDAMTAIGDTGYYDVWALRIPGVLESDCWHDVNRLRTSGMTREQAVDSAITRHNTFMNGLKEPTIVHSAFNVGMLLKVSAIHPCCRYVGTVNGWETCEHVPFQNCLRSHGARILFNPNFKL
jgi:hypothetical protein